MNVILFLCLMLLQELSGVIPLLVITVIDQEMQALFQVVILSLMI